MREVNPLQYAFFTALASIQEECVQNALCQMPDSLTEGQLYDLTADVIIRVMELLDGYAAPETGRLQVVSEKMGFRLQEEPCLELHDVICAYLKDS